MDQTQIRGAGFLLILLLAVFPLYAQQELLTFDDEAEALFNDGLGMFRAGGFREATTAFDMLIAMHPGSHRITAAYVMKAKGLYTQHENLEAARTLKTFLGRYPGSSYLADAHLMLGWIYERIARDQDALHEYREAWRCMPDPCPEKLSRLVVAAMDRATGRRNDASDVRKLLGDSGRPDERAYFWLRIGELELAGANVPAAAIVSDTLETWYPDARFGARISELKEKVASGATVVLGAVLPLMLRSPPSAVRELADEVYNGIVYAVERATNDPAMRMRILLETRDTERDPAIAAAEVTALANDPAVIGIVGPIFSATALSAAAAARDGRVPMVSPTANANGIAAVGPWVFQVNPDYDTRGRAMARYAILRRGFSTFLVLAPSDSYARHLAEGFISEVQLLGGTLVGVEWYERGTSDLKPQLSRLRRTAMQRVAEPLIPFGGKLRRAELMKLVDVGVPVRRIDSLMAHGGLVPAGFLLGENARRIVDSLQLSTAYDESHLDSLEYPVTGIDAFYAPISSPDEIGVVSSQIVYFHFDTALLGSGEWNNLPELFANKRYCEGIMFETDTFVDSATVAYREFVDGFLSRFRKAPTRNTMYGYDAANLVVTCILNGAGTREALARALAGIQDFRGLRSPVTFTSGRVNGWLAIVEYVREAVRRLDEIRVE